MSEPVIRHRPHKHPGTETVLADPAKPRVVLVGNPNVGKSVVFNYLSGLYVDVSNFPGTTVEVSKASYLHYDLFDTPGIYGVSSFNDEERVARDIILNGDIIINIVDAVHLERDLFLTQQLIDMGKRVGVVVNMLDEAKNRSIGIDLAALEEALGVPVVGTVAVRKKGLEDVHALIVNAREGRQHRSLHTDLHAMLATVGSQAEALMVLEGDGIIAQRHGIAASDASRREEIYIGRRNRVNTLLQRVVSDAHASRRIAARLGRWSVSPWFGFPILAVILTAVYFFVGVFVAQDVVGFTEGTVGQGIVEFHIKSWIARNAATTVTVDRLDAEGEVAESRAFRFDEGLHADYERWAEARRFPAGHDATFTFSFDNPWLVLFFGEFGAITMTFTYLVFLLLPLVLGFYFALSVLEDSGYLPRLATLVDRVLRYIGLNGRAVIPLILGFGCVTMATITTRLLGSQRERTIATTILQLAIPCSAQLGVIAALLATAGATATLIYTGVIFSFLVLVGTVMNRSLPGEVSPLLIDLPMMRMPRLDNVMKKTLYKTWFFMKEASPWFFIGALTVGILQVTGALVHIMNGLEPLVVNWLQLPREAATAFVMGLVRRDFGAAGLYHLNLVPFQTVAALVTITLFVPCVASLMVMLKERGLREGAIIWVGSLVLALTIGGIVSQILI
ncbi:MAG: ferrous iron transporter B [Bacteroidota bacterium]|jgi:ferrous iron transport protein B|nr:ferrous iron transporter B [Bacteroidota bacterium]